MNKRLLGIIAGLMLLGVTPVGAQEYPNKVITMVVPFAAGGPTDTVARLIAVPMTNHCAGTVSQASVQPDD